jgi:hypothetical protein
MKLTKTQKKGLAESKRFIQKLQKQEDYWYSYWCLVLNTKDENGWLNDYFFNNGSMKVLEVGLRKNK